MNPKSWTQRQAYAVIIWAYNDSKWREASTKTQFVYISLHATKISKHNEIMPTDLQLLSEVRHYKWPQMLGWLTVAAIAQHKRSSVAEYINTGFRKARNTEKSKSSSISLCFRDETFTLNKPSSWQCITNTAHKSSECNQTHKDWQTIRQTDRQTWICM